MQVRNDPAKIRRSIAELPDVEHDFGRGLVGLACGLDGFGHDAIRVVQQTSEWKEEEAEPENPASGTEPKPIPMALIQAISDHSALLLVIGAVVLVIGPLEIFRAIEDDSECAFLADQAQSLLDEFARRFVGSDDQQCTIHLA